MLRDKQGNRLFRKMTVKVIFPDGIFPDKVFVQHAGPKQGFGPDGIYAMLDQVADQLDSLYPFWDFTPTEMAPEGRTTRWLFKFAGYRDPTPAPLSPLTESTTLEPETAQVNPPATNVEPTLQSLPSQEQV